MNLLSVFGNFQQKKEKKKTENDQKLKNNKINKDKRKMCLIILTGEGECKDASYWIDHSQATFEVWFPNKIGHGIDAAGLKEILKGVEKGSYSEKKLREKLLPKLETILGPAEYKNNKKVEKSLSDISLFNKITTATLDHQLSYSENPLFIASKAIELEAKDVYSTNLLFHFNEKSLDKIFLEYSQSANKQAFSEKEFVIQVSVEKDTTFPLSQILKIFENLTIGVVTKKGVVIRHFVSIANELVVNPGETIVELNFLLADMKIYWGASRKSELFRKL